MHINGNGKTSPQWLLEVRRANGDARRLVEAAFLRACRTLEELEDGELRVFEVRTAWPKFRREYFDAYRADDVDELEDRFTPTPHDLDLLLPVLAWGRGLDRQQWMIARDAAAGFSAEGIADRLRLRVDQVRWHYELALDEVCRAALVDRA